MSAMSPSRTMTMMRSYHILFQAVASHEKHKIQTWSWSFPKWTNRKRLPEKSKKLRNWPLFQNLSLLRIMLNFKTIIAITRIIYFATGVRSLAIIKMFALRFLLVSFVSPKPIIQKAAHKKMFATVAMDLAILLESALSARTPIDASDVIEIMMENVTFWQRVKKERRKCSSLITFTTIQILDVLDVLILGTLIAILPSLSMKSDIEWNMSLILLHHSKVKFRLR